jgi:predicted anti-sigma-YlaC factor YlaD
MRCDQARPLLLKGEQAEAELHLSTCDACFEWLEAHDPIVSLLKAARPSAAAVPSGLATGVAERWQPHRVSLRLGIAAAMALSLGGLALAAVAILAAPAVAASTLVSIGDAATTAAGIVDDLLAVPRSLIFDQPLTLVAFTAATVLVCALWARLYQQSQDPRRISS